ncbi:hypothetical protein D9M70_535540 [compost metagenome]
MPDLGQERRRPHPGVGPVARHGCVELGNENARVAAGVREYGQQLLLRDLHVGLQKRRSPASRGFWWSIGNENYWFGQQRFGLPMSIGMNKSQFLTQRGCRVA